MKFKFIGPACSDPGSAALRWLRTATTSIRVSLGARWLPFYISVYFHNKPEIINAILPVRAWEVKCLVPAHWQAAELGQEARFSEYKTQAESLSCTGAPYYRLWTEVILAHLITQLWPLPVSHLYPPSCLCFTIFYINPHHVPPLGSNCHPPT